MIGGRLTFLTAVSVSLWATTLVAAGSGEWLQPASSRGDLRATFSEERLEVLQDSGGLERVPLRRGERPLQLAETVDGWAAVGIGPASGSRHLVDIFLLQRRGGIRERSSLPGDAERILSRTGPALLLDTAGELAGLAWLEGALGAPLVVRAARRTNDGWQAPSTVALPTAGSQTGLSAAALPDGRWLLAWSRFDGEDDEVVWSVGAEDEWSSPAPLHPPNGEPDVMTQLFAGLNGPIAVWNRRVHGEYRVLVATFSGGGWGTPREISGPGGVHPTWAGSAADPYVVFNEARDGTWRIVDLDANAAPLRASVGVVSKRRPALVFASATEPRILATGAGSPLPLSWEPLP